MAKQGAVNELKRKKENIQEAETQITKEGYKSIA